MIEVEIKVALANPDEFIKKMKELKGKYLVSLEHEDTYFNMPKGLRNFRKTDEALRLRKSTEFNKEDQNNTILTKYYITYKGKKVDQTTKTREEIEVELKNVEDMKKVLTKLGFREVYTVKKERELFEIIIKQKKIEVLTDYIPILKQHFLEVELMTDSKSKINQAKQILFYFLSQFNISEKDSIRQSYLELITNKLGII